MDTMNVVLPAGVWTPVLAAADDWAVVGWRGQSHVEFARGGAPAAGVDAHLLPPGSVLSKLVFGGGEIWARCNRAVTLVIS